MRCFCKPAMGVRAGEAGDPPRSRGAAKFSPALRRRGRMRTFLLWCVVFFLCWPLAVAALVLYPLVWLLLVPFRVVGVAVDGVLGMLKAVLTLPARMLGYRLPAHDAVRQVRAV